MEVKQVNEVWTSSSWTERFWTNTPVTEIFQTPQLIQVIALSINKHVRCSMFGLLFKILNFGCFTPKRNDFGLFRASWCGNTVLFHCVCFFLIYSENYIIENIYYLLEITSSSEELLPGVKKISFICKIRNDLTKTFDPKA